MSGESFNKRKWTSATARYRARGHYLNNVLTVEQLMLDVHMVPAMGGIDDGWDDYPPERIADDEAMRMIEGANTMLTNMHDTKCVGLVDGAHHSYMDPEKRCYPHAPKPDYDTGQPPDNYWYVKDLSADLDPDDIPTFADADADINFSGERIDSDGKPWDKGE